MKNLFYCLGVDAGASKTEALIMDSREKILGRAEGKAGSFNACKDWKQAVKNIEITVKKALDRAKLKKIVLDSVYIGMAGLDTEKSRLFAERELKKQFKPYLKRAFFVRNDVSLVLRTELEKNFGVALISGTGSNCYGVNKKGEEAYSSGLGHIMADQGSGYWIGLEMFRAATKSYDGRGPKTILQNRLMEYFEVKEFRDISDIIYLKNSFGKKEIASLCLLIEEDKAPQDKVLKSILDQAAYELFLNIHAVVSSLKMQNTVFPVVCAGSILTKKKYLQRRFKVLIQGRFPKAKILFLKREPVVGAVYLALDQIS